MTPSATLDVALAEEAVEQGLVGPQLVGGALERIWAAHASAVFQGGELGPAAPSVWRASLREHRQIVAAIERADIRAGDLARRHLEAMHAYMSALDDNRMVTAATVRR